VVLITETFPFSGFLNIPQLITGEKTQIHKDGKVVKISIPSAGYVIYSKKLINNIVVLGKST